MGAKRCPTPGKVKYRKGIDAKLALAQIKSKGKPGHDECRIYACGKHFHLTSAAKNR